MMMMMRCLPFENEDEDVLNTRGHKFLVLQRNCETERKTSSAFQADTSVGVDGDRSGLDRHTFCPVLGALVKSQK